MIELSLDGRTRSDIAEETGYTPEGVGLITKSPLFQAELARRRTSQLAQLDQERVERTRDAFEVLTDAATRAAQKQVELLDSADARIAQASAMDILDRAGFPKRKEVVGMKGMVQIQLSGEDLRRIQETTRTCFGKDFPFETEETETPSSAANGPHTVDSSGSAANGPPESAETPVVAENPAKGE
jgi:hypothetical protein